MNKQAKYKSTFHKHKQHLILIDILMKYTAILQYFSNLREVVIHKYTDFADSEYYEYTGVKEKYKLVKQSGNLVKHIKSLPFIREISLRLRSSPIYPAYIPDRPDLMTNA